MAVTSIENGAHEPATNLLRVSAGKLLLALILIIAAVIRFGLLGSLALDPAEARQALTVWSYWQPPDAQAAAGAVSPAYFAFSALFFAFLGASDVTTRLAPALFGMMAVLLPWLWRSRLGNAGALAVGALFAVSPTMTILSATAGGEAMSVAAILLLFIAWMRYRDEGDVRWLFLVGAAFGFGLATSPLFYSLFVTLVVAWLLQRLLPLSLATNHAGNGSGVQGLTRRLLIVLTAVVFLLTATLFLFRPAGLGDAAMQFALWLGQFELTGGVRALLTPYLALTRYEIAAVTLGAAAILWASWRGYALPQFLVYWFAATLFLPLFQQGVVSNVAAMIVPSYLLFGLLLNSALNRPAGHVRWALAITIFLLGAVVYFNAVRYLRVMQVAPQQVGFLFLTFVAIASIFVAVNFVRSWDAGAAYQGALVGLLLLCAIYSWGTARWMVAEGRNDPREYWTDVGSDDDLRLLATLLEELSWQSTASANRLQVLAAVETPALRWYLRDFPNVQFGQTVPPGANYNAIITSAEEDTPAPGDVYLGTDLGLTRTTGAELDSVPLSLSDTLRWWIFHEHPAPYSGERIILWARGDMLE